MSKAKFDAAKELINEKRYDEARALLKTVDHPTAREWEAKLDKITPKFANASKPVRRRNNSRLGCIALLLILAVVLINFLPNAPKQPEQPSVAIDSTLTERNATFTATKVDTPEATATITETPFPSETAPPTATHTPTITPSPIPTSIPMKFDSNSSGQQPVLGPLTFPSGIHKVVVQTNGFFIAQLETVSGTCDAGFIGLFNLTAGQGKGGAGNVLKSEDCIALIEISNVSDDWTIEFQQINQGTPRTTRLTFDNNTDGTQPLLGPLSIPSGTYRARVVTNGFFIAQLETVSGTCDAGFIGLFNLSSGQANNGAETIFRSTDCVALITINNVTEPWTLEFELIT